MCSDGLLQVQTGYFLLNKWTQNSPVTLEGRALLDFLQAEDKGASEGCKQRSCCWFSSQGHRPGGRSSPVVGPASLSAAPQPACPAASHSLHTQNLLSSTEAETKMLQRTGRAQITQTWRSLGLQQQARKSGTEAKQSKAKQSQALCLVPSVCRAHAVLCLHLNADFR